MAGPVISESSELGRELWKWNHTDREIHPADEDKPSHEQLRGVRPSVHQEYPKLLYKAQKKSNGVISVGDVTPNPMHFERMDQYERATMYTEGFNRTCQRLVGNDEEERKAKRDGWCEKQEEALDKLEGLERDMARASAEAIAANQRMTDKAKAEFKAAEEATSDHVTDVQPKKK